MKLKQSDWCYLSSKSIILINKFPKLEFYKSLLSTSPNVFIEQIKKEIDINEETNELEEILNIDWKRTLSFFEKKITIKNIFSYFNIERNYYKKINNLPDEKRVNILKEKFENEISLYEDLPFLINLIKVEIDFYNIESFLKYKYFNTSFNFISSGNISYNKFKNFEKESLENFIEFINSNYKGFIEKNLIEFLQYFEKKKDEYFIRILKNSKYFVFGPEIVFSYLKLKDYHYINLNTIYNGLIYNQPSDLIYRRLRVING